MYCLMICILYFEEMYCLIIWRSGKKFTKQYNNNGDSDGSGDDYGDGVGDLRLDNRFQHKFVPVVQFYFISRLHICDI